MDQHSLDNSDTSSNQPTATSVVEIFLSDIECRDLMERREALRASIGELPPGFSRNILADHHEETRFDANRLLAEVYDAVRLKSGYLLDYVYAADAHGGEPFLYARAKEEAPLATVEDLFRVFSVGKRSMLLGEETTPALCKPFAHAISFIANPTGFFQFALFCMSARRFYLYWHSNYNDRLYLTTTRSLISSLNSRLGDITDDEEAILASLDPRPRLRISGKRAEVTMLSYERNLGYSWLTVDVEWPNVFRGFEDRIIIRSRNAILY